MGNHIHRQNMMRQHILHNNELADTENVIMEDDEEIVMLESMEDDYNRDREWHGKGNSKYPKRDYQLYEPSDIAYRVCDDSFQSVLVTFCVRCNLFWK